MQKVIVGLLLLLITAGLFSAKPPLKEKKDLWQSWKTVNELFAKEQKPILIDIYADWCHYCRVMDATTYKNDSVYSYLKNNFYRFKFNAEGKDSMTWQNKTFQYNNWYKVHDFAVYLTRGSIVYPTTVVIVPGAQPYYVAGELKPAELEMILKFFGERHDKNDDILSYSKTFKPQWK